MKCAVALTALLWAAILAIWAPERWPWAVVQVGVFALVAGNATLPVRLRPATAALLAIAAWPFMQLAMGQTVSRGATWTAAIDWWTFALIFLLAVQVFEHRAAREWFLRAAALGGAAVALLAVAQTYSSHGAIYWIFPSGYSEDVLGPFVNRNQFAAWIELLFPTGLWLAATSRQARALYAVAAAVMFSAAMASGSRAGCVLVVLEAVTVLVLLRWRGQRSRAMQFGALAAAGVAVVGCQSLLSRFAGTAGDALRWDALRASVRMVRDHPWAGSGLGTWPSMYPRYAGFDSGLYMNQAHNDWAQWAAEGGLPFLLLMIFFAGTLMKPAFRSIYGVGIGAFLLHALLDYPMQQRPALAAWFFLVAGAVYAGRRTHADSHDDLLRGVGHFRNGLARRDPAGLQAACPADPPRSLRG